MFNVANLDIDITKRCDLNINSELIPRLTNRIVIIKERIPFSFSTPKKTEKFNDNNNNVRSHDIGETEFEKNTMIAFVVIVSSV